MRLQKVGWSQTAIRSAHITVQRVYDVRSTSGSAWNVEWKYFATKVNCHWNVAHDVNLTFKFLLTVIGYSKRWWKNQMLIIISACFGALLHFLFAGKFFRFLCLISTAFLLIMNINKHNPTDFCLFLFKFYF